MKILLIIAIISVLFSYVALYFNLKKQIGYYKELISIKDNIINICDKQINELDTKITHLEITKELYEVLFNNLKKEQND